MKAVFILAFLLVLSPLVLATQDLTYLVNTSTVAISYDSLGRIATKNASSFASSYAYDAQFEGTVTNVTFQNSSIEYDYDGKMRITKETRVINGFVFEKQIIYDSMGRVVKMAFAPGNATENFYNGQGKTSGINGFVNATSHGAFGAPVNRTYGNPLVTLLSYDSNTGRLTRIKTSSIQDLNYVYDSASNIVSITDVANSRAYAMAYDALDRLVNATIGPYYFIYSYDAGGRILKIARNNTNTTKFIYGSYPVHAPSKVESFETGIDANKESELYSNNKTRAIEFYLSNDDNASVNNVNWTLSFGNAMAVSSSLISLNSNESILVIIANDYANGGKYEPNITAFAGEIRDYENTSLVFGISIDKVSFKGQSADVASFEIELRNTLSFPVEANWACGSSSGTLIVPGFGMNTSSFSASYSASGQKTLNCNVTSSEGGGSRAIDFTLKGIEIEDYSSEIITESSRRVNFTLRNYWSPLTATWLLEDQSGSSVLGTNQSEAIARAMGYTTDGRKTIRANASSGSLSNAVNETIIAKALRIADYQSDNLTATGRIIFFRVPNKWNSTQGVRWNITDPQITSDIITNLTENEELLVVIEANHSSQGTKTPSVNAYSNVSVATSIDRFFVKIVEVLRYLILHEGDGKVISEIDARNNLGTRNVTWGVYGTTNISSSQNTGLNSSESVFIIVEDSYGVRQGTGRAGSGEHTDEQTAAIAVN
ncbi:MAG: hypothetical protein HZB68_04215 [Candidatus Aenigmarchaeota archaeon]|nr:hypothetical protein [Candidatus Aenigmarchaeota archaeon]